jgi:hypothetical protein
MRKFRLDELEANQLFNKLLKGKYITSVEIEIDQRTYYGYKANLEHPQVQMMVKIAGYMVS